MRQRAECPRWIPGETHAFDLLPMVQVCRARTCTLVQGRSMACLSGTHAVLLSGTHAALLVCVVQAQALVERKEAQKRVRAVVMEHLCDTLTPLYMDSAHLRCASFLCQMDASFEVSERLLRAWCRAFCCAHAVPCSCQPITCPRLHHRLLTLCPAP